MNKTEAQIKEIIKRTLVIDNPQSIDEFTVPRIMEIVNKESRESIIEFFKWCMNKDTYVLVGKRSEDKDGICTTSITDLVDEWFNQQGEIQ